jgi:hypothetical protein
LEKAIEFSQWAGQSFDEERRSDARLELEAITAELRSRVR